MGGVSINVNNISLVHKSSNGIAIATVPDVCKTPSPAGPVPIPYPNIARSSNLAKGTKRIKVDGGNSAAIKGSEFSSSNGDEAGTVGGVKSGVNMKEATWITCSFDVKLEGKGACRLTDKMQMNHGNTVCLGGEVQAPVGDGSSSEHGENVKKGFDKIDKNRKPPDGPIDYKNNTIAGKDVSGRIRDAPPEGEFIWVQLMDGSFSFASRPLGSRPAGLSPFPHPLLSKGNPVKSAGEGICKNSKITHFYRKSGHFQPTIESLFKAAKDMERQGFSAENMKIIKDL